VITRPPAFSAREVHLTGQVKNETNHSIILGTVTATLRDKASGKIIATGWAPLAVVDALAAGEMLNFSLTIPVASDFDLQTMQFEITASGQAI
jgi:hypothetical protein